MHPWEKNRRIRCARPARSVCVNGVCKRVCMRAYAVSRLAAVDSVASDGSRSEFRADERL